MENYENKTPRRMNIMPAVYKVHKGAKEAIQFHLEPAAVEEGNAFNLKSGSILLQMAKPSGQRDGNGNATYNWKEKDCYKLKADELSQILLVLQERKERASFVHDPGKAGSDNAGIKNLFVEWKTYEKNSGTVKGVLLTIRHGERSICVGLAEAEIVTLRILIQAAIPDLRMVG